MPTRSTCDRPRTPSETAVSRGLSPRTKACERPAARSKCSGLSSAVRDLQREVTGGSGASSTDCRPLASSGKSTSLARTSRWAACTPFCASTSRMTFVKPAETTRQGTPAASAAHKSSAAPARSGTLAAATTLWKASGVGSPSSASKRLHSAHHCSSFMDRAYPPGVKSSILPMAAPYAAGIRGECPRMSWHIGEGGLVSVWSKSTRS
mmetsp:Transcript_25247/g.79650  ORF Transcript_25247/g.79650 Transcript_25247/m.79650 type:complete len:208 (-) Transcript_25247:247-870(-)